MKRYKCSQLPPSVEGHYVYLASDVEEELSQMASAVECKSNEIFGLKERIAELQKYLRSLVAQCEKSADGNVPIAGCVCKVCDLAREAALVASSL